MSTPSPALSIRGLVKTFRDARGRPVEAVRGIDLDAYPGEVLGLLGANGAGKTTTLRILASLLKPTSGTAYVGDLDVVEHPLETRRRIGFLSANTGLYPRLTGRETLQHFGRLHGIDKRALRERIEELVESFQLSAIIDRRCETLSTGNKQRVSIARAVLHDPQVLILDEPTSGLDVLATSAMIDFVERARDLGTCVVFSTHVLSEAERLCDRIGVLHAGRLLAVAEEAELCAQTGTEWLEDAFRVLIEPTDREERRSA